VPIIIIVINAFNWQCFYEPLLISFLTLQSLSNRVELESEFEFETVCEAGARVTDILGLNLLTRTWTDVQIHNFVMPLSINQSPRGWSLLAAFYCIMPGYGSGTHSFCQLTKPGPLYQVHPLTKLTCPKNHIARL